MKNFILFTVALLSSLAVLAAGGENIGIGTALGYFFGETSYLVWLLVGTVVGGYLVYRGVNSYKTTGDWGANEIISIGIGVLIFLFALLYAPAEAAANTSVEMYEKTGEVIR